MDSGQVFNHFWLYVSFFRAKDKGFLSSHNDQTFGEVKRVEYPITLKIWKKLNFSFDVIITFHPETWTSYEAYNHVLNKLLLQPIRGEN